MSQQLPIFIDFEASSLRPESYPIEVAWNNRQGEIHSWLINPELSIDKWDEWDSAAERLHGLKRETLIEQGVSPQVVAQHALSNLPSVIYSDNPDFDAFWLDRLFAACGLSHPYIVKDAIVWLYRMNPDFAMFEASAREAAGGIHRAGYDVAYLLNLAQHCRK